MTNPEVIILVEDLRKLYPVKKNFFQSLTSVENEFVHAVDGLSFEVLKGETFGLVGESGCGKSTTGYLTLNLIPKTSGKVSFKGKNIHNISKNDLRKLRQKIQIIFQNPYDALSPRFNVYDIIAEPLRLLNVVSDEKKVNELVYSILEEVGLSPASEYIERFPHELSGGQRQRIGVARAFVLNPEFVVADEPVSMLDVSLRIGILKIMKKLIKNYGTAFLFITHDLALARYMCDRIAVMYLGKIVEKGEAEQVTQNPMHPYTRALIMAVPEANPDASRLINIPIIGEVSDGIHIPSGCRFQDRCLYTIDLCKKEEPQLVKIDTNHYVACFRVDEIDEILNKIGEYD